MAITTTCDICDQPAGHRSVKVDLPYEAHPHNGEPCGRHVVDICPACLPWVQKLTAAETVGQIRLRRAVNTNYASA